MYGDPSRFKNWPEVTVPDIQGFFGSLEEGGLRLAEKWQWRKASGGDDEPPPADDAAWTPLAVQPSQQQAFLPWGAAFYRTEFDAAEWLRKNEGHTVYLVSRTYPQQPARRRVAEWPGTGPLQAAILRPRTLCPQAERNAEAR